MVRGVLGARGGRGLASRVLVESSLLTEHRGMILDPTGLVLGALLLRDGGARDADAIFGERDRKQATQAARLGERRRCLRCQV